MNERIKELSKRSGGVHSHGYERGEPINRVIFSVDELEKFAELIVRECALQCVHNEDMDLIEKHFGVEE